MIAIQIRRREKKTYYILKSMSGTEESYGRLWNKRAELISQAF